MKILIICEKPSVAEAIATAIGGARKKGRYYENDGYVVSWAYGHLLELCDAGDYDKRYKRWTMASLPIIPELFKLKLRPGKDIAQQFDTIKSLFARPDIGSVINACDAGREGELIFRYLCRAINQPKPTRRLWLSSVVPEAITAALSKMKDGSAYDQLAAAAEARSECDWLVGINATRAYTVRNKSLLHLGRVLTPTLAMLVNRELEIRDFQSREYWEIFADFAGQGFSYRGKWFGADGNRLFDSEPAQRIAQSVDQQSGLVTKLDRKEIKKQPPLLYNLTDLQKEANRRYKFSATKTLGLAQKLYEEKKLLTYPRTDSNYLTKDVFATAGRILDALNHPPYAELIGPLLRGKLPFLPRVVNDRKVNDHHAIIPTTQNWQNQRLTPDEQKIFALVAKRFIAVFYPPALYAETEVVTVVAGESFLTKSRTLIFPGWQAVYGREESEADSANNLIPADLAAGATPLVTGVEVSTGLTQPPSRYTEGTLLGAMETAGKQVEDQELREMLREKGIGTVASRPPIIEKLKSADYAFLEGLYLTPTEKGIALIQAITINRLTSPELTGEWEKRLRDIENGTEQKDRFLMEVQQFAHDIVESASSLSSITGVTQSPSLGLCPLCGGKITESPKAYGCANWRQGCSFTIWKVIAGKKLTPKQAQTLLEKGRTGKLRGFKSKAGKSFAAQLVIESGKVVFEF